MVALAALAALAVAIDASEPAPKDSSPRFRLLPPYADPGFVRGPAPPPDKSYLIALAEVIGIDTLIWAIDYSSGKPYAKISLDSIKQNFDKGWIIDTDDFWANSLMHPLHGNLDYNAARSLGLNFYESFGYAFLGSLIWEQFAEIQPPSMNDQVNTPFGGTMLGETLFRMSRLILDSGGYQPGGWRQFFAFLINPAGGVNRLLFGNKYRGELLLPPSWIGEFRFGMVVAGSSRNDPSAARKTDVGPWGSASAYVVYGVPGTPELSLNKPFDHFEASASLSLTGDITVQPTATLLIRGLLLGEPITLGGEPGGLWGLFTSYDFIAPAIFRVQGFGVGPGVALRKRWGWFELHGTGVAELLPWSGGGWAVPVGVRDYHYGPGGDVVLGLRGHFGDRVTVRLEGRQYWISGAYARGESENISYGKVEATVRIYGMHGVSGTLDWAHRQASYAFQPDIWQRASVVSLFYTLLQGW